MRLMHDEITELFPFVADEYPTASRVLFEETIRRTATGSYENLITDIKPSSDSMTLIR